MNNQINNTKIILAVPKGRILDQALPILKRAGIEPEPAFFQASDRRLRFTSNHQNIDIIRVRSFDVATFLAYGAAHLAIAGSDVLEEFNHPEIYAPVDLAIGKCRLVVAASKDTVSEADQRQWSHLRVATKYPQTTRRYFAKKGVQVECIKLNGAMEIAPNLGLCRRIVDLVETGSTLTANGLVEIAEIMTVSSRFAVNRAAWKMNPDIISGWISKIREAAHN
ncbi:ATP phosphoribosyltransferase [Alphaproteobacteria bacterium]|jgi:ATP phosphoribosyltransferase|nr:ATP phosphoribosyltransferase [Alphaproteobacteria bacterium]MDC0394820.1 ATP phosphoribosyltransferase [Alphaproteobacteria bacterium]MDC0461582.1 ATP phosphoribosyltransferase [Alphaproteobacteria bacterium]